MASGAWLLVTMALAAQDGAPPDAVLDAQVPVSTEPIAVLDQGPRGPLYAPLGPGDGRFRMSLGLLFDALSPEAVAGARLAVPQVLADARYGLGGAFDVLGHVNTIVAYTQAEVGFGVHGVIGPVPLQARVYGGALLGALNGFGFETLMVSPLVRPGLVAGIPVGDHWLSLAFDTLFVPVQQVRVGTADVTVSSFNAFLGLTVSFTAEVALRHEHMLFYGAALMYTRASYQAWVLFSDEPNLLAYPRVFAGYAF